LIKGVPDLTTSTKDNRATPVKGLYDPIFKLW